MSSTEFLLLLHNTPHVGEKALARMLRLAAQQRLSPESFLRMSRTEWEQQCELHPLAAAALESQRQQMLARSAEIARSLRAHGVQLLSVESATYPGRLIRYDDAPPPLLYTVGNLSLLDWGYTAESFTFSVAVSNGASPESLARLDRMASELAGCGAVPVSGHDRAPYQRLALAAQRLNRPTVYVLDRGLREALGSDFDRPLFAAARIRELSFSASRDLALSAFRLDDHSIGDHNRRRDGLVLALSDVVIALDVRAGGAMAESCALAHRQKRPVFVVRGGRDGGEELAALGCPTLPESGWLAEVREAARSARHS